jgi:hypothetical protein
MRADSSTGKLIKSNKNNDYFIDTQDVCILLFLTSKIEFQR